MVARKSSGKSASGGGRVRPAEAAAKAGTVIVTREQSEHLIEDVAHFRAARHRRILPGQYREQDRREAERQIRTVLKGRGKRG
ncbi:MAG: hypothetical protein KIT18_14125 [Burkholderiales bacterium]|nr:hypothetical protein [Burkholderiales bacterium]